MAKGKLKPTDGFGPKEKKRVRQVIRQVWHQCHARKLVVNRCVDAKGFPVCEGCSKRVPKITVDHIEPVGEVDSGFLKRMFVPSNRLRGVCSRCHREKTNRENKARRDAKNKKMLGF